MDVAKMQRVIEGHLGIQRGSKKNKTSQRIRYENSPTLPIGKCPPRVMLPSAPVGTILSINHPECQKSRPSSRVNMPLFANAFLNTQLAAGAEHCNTNHLTRHETTCVFHPITPDVILKETHAIN